MKIKKRYFAYLFLFAAFIYLEFFFLGVQIHQEYVETTLTREEAMKECPDMLVSESDRAWMMQVLDALDAKNFPDGEYSLQELELPPHPDYATADTKITVTHSKLPYHLDKEEHLYLYISAYFDGIIMKSGMKSGNKRVSLRVDELASAFEDKGYYELECWKGVRCYLNSIFTKEFPDIIYYCDDRGYGMLERKHKWFAIVRAFFTMK